MENIFEGAKFGDKFVTRDGMPAIFLDREIHPYIDDNNPGFAVIHVAVYHHIDYKDGTSKDYAIVQAYDEYGYRERFNHHETEDDIVSKYKEPIDEERLNELAIEHAKKELSHSFNPNSTEAICCISDFKAGYKKAKEEEK